MEMAIRFQLFMVMVVKITWANFLSPKSFSALLYTSSETPSLEIRVTCSASFKTILSSSVKKGVSHQALTANSRCVVSPDLGNPNPDQLFQSGIQLKRTDLFVGGGHRLVNGGLRLVDAHSFKWSVFPCMLLGIASSAF